VTRAGPALLAIGRSRLLLDSIEHLSRQGFHFAAIATAPASPEYDATPTDFQRLARRLGCEYFLLTSSTLPRELTEVVESGGVKAAVSVNWQYVLPQAFLDLFPLGLLNLHLGNMPDYKGNATVNWAIINGTGEIHANVHKMSADLDSGDVIVRRRIGIDDTTYVGDDVAPATEMAPELFEQALRILVQDPDAHVVRGNPQGLRCYPRLPQVGLIAWSQPAAEVARLVRASSRPYAGAFSHLADRRVVVWRAGISSLTNFLAVPGHVLGAEPGTDFLRVACGEGALSLEEVSVDGYPMAPITLTRSIRARFTPQPSGP
jgi:methionyl-tRNA formyltransferase